MQTGRGMRARQGGGRQLRRQQKPSAKLSRPSARCTTRTCRLLLCYAKRRPSCLNTGQLPHYSNTTSNAPLLEHISTTRGRSPPVQRLCPVQRDTSHDVMKISRWVLLHMRHKYTLKSSDAQPANLICHLVRQYQGLFMSSALMNPINPPRDGQAHHRR